MVYKIPNFRKYRFTECRCGTVFDKENNESIIKHFKLCNKRYERIISQYADHHVQNKFLKVARRLDMSIYD